MDILQELKDLIFKLLAIDGISGFEEPMMKALVEELKPSCDEVYDTPRGNIIGIQKGTDPDAPALALVAHTDQVGFIVFNIDETFQVRKHGRIHRTNIVRCGLLVYRRRPIRSRRSCRPTILGYSNLEAIIRSIYGSEMSQ